MRPLTTEHAPGAEAPYGSAAEELVRELHRRWRDGDLVPAEELLGRRPELWQDPEAAIDLVYEEYCLRQARGDDSADADILRRFPQWAGPLGVMLDCHRRLLEPAGDCPQFPGVGDMLCGFRVLSEIDRGAHGRVYLAAQTSLAGRRVVLKVTPLDGAAEHLSLARLQHTHIVPIHTALDDGVRNVRVLCMPYFGRATLAAVLEQLAPIPCRLRTGQHLVDAIDGRQDGPVSAQGPVSASRQMLGGVSYERAMCWVAAGLAEALQFAHERGLVHLDLKPSNVLITPDGQPMLLDFHLARAPVRPGGAIPERFGGTPGYMAPEQRAAMHALEQGLPIEHPVDGRADTHALGAILYEALGGRLPPASGPARLTSLNRSITPGVAAIVARCLAGAPGDRYPDAAALADDLRRHLTDQPLAGVRNRSVRERWRKWRRRTPGALRHAAAIAVMAAAVVAVAAGVRARWHERHGQAEAALHDARRQRQAGDPAEAVRTLERGARLITGAPFDGALTEHLRDELRAVHRDLLVRDIRALADEVRVTYDPAALGPGGAAALSAQCDRVWRQRDTVLRAVGAERASDVTTDLLDVAIFFARLKARSPSAVPGAVALLREASETLGTSAVLEHERRSLSPAGVAEPASTTLPRTAWEHTAIGRARLIAGDLEVAERELARAVQLDPGGRWPNFYAGLCAHRAGRYDDAVAALGVCIGAAPGVAGFYYNRANSYAALGREERAGDDYATALRLDPAHAPAAQNRGLLRLRQKQYGLALADLERALEHGADPAEVHYNIALVCVGRGDERGASERVARALLADPGHRQSLRLRTAMESATTRPRVADPTRRRSPDE